MVAVLPIVVNALVIVPRLYGNVRTAEIAPEGEHAGDIPNPSQEINSIGISCARLFVLREKSPRGNFVADLNFRTKWCVIAPLTRGRLSSGHPVWRAGGKAAPLLAA